MHYKQVDTLVLIVTYNPGDETFHCVKSIRYSEYTDYDILLVDNDSEDRRVLNEIANRWPGIHIMFNSDNLGFAAGINSGLKFGLKKDYKYFVILNNDVILEKKCLKRLIDCASANRDIGAVCPKIYYATGFTEQERRIWYAGGAYSQWMGIARPWGKNQLDKGSRSEASWKPCSFLTGAAMLIKREVVEKIGLWDENLFLYGEDVDYSLRIRKAGYSTGFVPQAVAWHYVGRSQVNKQARARRLYYNTRNTIYIMKKHNFWYHWWTVAPNFCIRWLVYMLIKMVVSGEIYSARLIIQGVRDGLLGRVGEYRGRK